MTKGSEDRASVSQFDSVEHTVNFSCHDHQAELVILQPYNAYILQLIVSKFTRLKSSAVCAKLASMASNCL